MVINNYELVLLFRLMPKNEIKQALQRTADQIFNKGGIIRKLEHLRTGDTPYKISSHGQVHKQASYYVYQFNAPPSSIDKLLDEYNRDVDVIRRRIYKTREPKVFECTLHEEMQPAPYRKDVQDLIEQARKLDKPKFQYKSGLDYYPFQK